MSTSLSSAEHFRKLPEPGGPFVDPIIQIHRGADGYVSIHRKHAGRWEDVASIRVSDLQRVFPQLRRELEADSYFSINAFYRPGYGTGLSGFPKAHRKGKDARYLNACFVELDAHGAQSFEVGFWLGIVVATQDRGLIPPASLICRSGRGLWLLWLLHHEQDPRIPPRAFAEHVLLFNALQGALSERLRKVVEEINSRKDGCSPGSQCSVDSSVKDVARVMRVPGSINSNASLSAPTRVQFWPQLDNRGKGYSYTLRGLAGLLGVEAPELRKDFQSKPGSNQKAIRGWRALWQQRFDDFHALRAIRGTFQEGCRNRAAYVYGVILRGVGFTEAAVTKLVVQFGSECSPPLSQNEVEGAIDQSRKSRRQLRDSLIAEYLCVTTEEAKQIPRWASDETVMKGRCMDISLSGRARIQLRDTVIRRTVESMGGRIPSSRRMAQILHREGVFISHVQVNRDYQRLGLSLNDVEMPLSLVSDVTLVGGEK